MKNKELNPNKLEIIDILYTYNHGIFERIGDNAELILHPNGHLDWKPHTNINFKNDKFREVKMQMNNVYEAMFKLQNGETVYYLTESGKIQKYENYHSVKIPAKYITKDRWLYKRKETLYVEPK